MNHPASVRRLGVGILSVSMLLAACSASAGPSPSPAPVAPSASPPASGAPPSDLPITAPPSSAPSDGGNLGGDKIVVPKPGQLDVRTVKADELVARVEGSSIIVTVSWTTGVEPCNVLDQVIVAPGEGAYSITLREGHGPEDVACIAIAETHLTEVVIKDVAPGTYQITDAAGGAAPIEVTVG